MTLLSRILGFAGLRHCRSFGAGMATEPFCRLPPAQPAGRLFAKAPSHRPSSPFCEYKNRRGEDETHRW